MSDDARDQKRGAAERITAADGLWPGVQTLPHRFGGVEIRFGHRELGHLQGDRITDLPFPRRLRDELIAVAARARTTCCRTAAGVTAPLGGLEAADGAIGLFGLSDARSVQAARPARLPRSLTHGGGITAATDERPFDA
ncbi:MAG: luciferase family protein [Solirubrobacteraceae bacterium]